MNDFLTPQAKQFLSQSIPQFINGTWINSESGKTTDVIDPSSGSKIATVSSGDAQDVNLAVVTADKAFKNWSALSPAERAQYLNRLADKLESESETLAQLEALDVGKAFVNADGFDIPFGIECVRYYADLAVNADYGKTLDLKDMDARVHRAPYGVCGFIFPWNFPFDLLMWNVIPALAAGNTVVIKPAELTPLTTLYVCKLAEEVGIPAGVINVVVGAGRAVGTPLIEHPKTRRISFTGSSGVGKQIASMCGQRPIPCKLELGGKGAAVVFDDADIDNAVEQLAGAITLNTGQVCCTATRWLIHENIYDQFVEKVTTKLKSTVIGPGIDPKTEMGPVVSQAQQNTVLEYLDKGLTEGAVEVLAGGKVSVNGHDGGYYVSPYLLTGSPNNICFKEEIFGPAAFLVKFKTEGEALELVNSLEYGLANSVFSRDIERCNRVAEQMIAGNSWINAHNVFAYGLPYGGINMSGVGGGVNSPETFYDYLRELTIARPLG
ncbi:aldehyde dehydrogenase family protein [Neptuniibacter marinus]|uniref:aldehyde dehydrogenase family protein n=1 Tax=Neptuniibacter marinus TaxID=1806670 RepID=UPI0008331CFB|nr:aldehyde dehydrogenase family protein [Neptuniibacter marinus]